MIHPSYTELIQAINSKSEDDDNTMLLNSRYSLVLATSKRARQIIAGAKPLVEGAEGKKPLSAAIDEFYQGKVKILSGVSEDETEVLENQPQAIVTEEEPDDLEKTPVELQEEAEDSAEAPAEE